MGCWNETCGVTQLPINHGDKVRVFVLFSSECWRGAAGGGTCYTTDRWTPIGAPVQGVYDDYGGIEKIVNNDASKFLLKIIRERWVPVEDDKDEKIPPVNKLTLGQVLHFIERDRAKYKPYFKEENLGIFFVLEDVYQAMIKFDSIEPHYLEKGFRYRPQSEIYRIDIESWYKHALETFANVKKDDDLLRIHLSFDMADDRIFSFSESGRGAGARPYKELLKGLAMEGVPFEDKRVQTACNTVFEILMFCNALSAQRKMWIPQCGKGGQHNDLEIYKHLNKAVASIIANRDKEDEEDGCCERDAEGYTEYMREQNAKTEE